MNMLTKWNPFSVGRSAHVERDLFRELDGIERRLESLFQRSPHPGDTNEFLSSGEWHPTVDISEDEKEYVLKADLPEIAKSDVKVSVRDGVLEISGDRKAESISEGRRYHRIERAHGTFLRAFSLPSGVEGEKAKAEFAAGVLTVRIPKNAETAPKPVEIKVA